MNVFGTVKTSINTREAAERYGVEVKERFPPRGKDYNDYLCDLLGLQRTTRKAKENTTNERV